MAMRLFSKEKLHLQLPDAELIYISDFFEKSRADLHFQSLKKNILWQQDDIKLFGKTYQQPRLTALYGEIGKSYTYSNILMKPNPFTEELLSLKNIIETKLNLEFTTVLLNYYRDGQDSNGWHADNEKELGKNPSIASLSLGAERLFHFKHRRNSEETYKIMLEHGSLLLMKGAMQHHWLHQLPKTKKKVGERINLTFRNIREV